MVNAVSVAAELGRNQMSGEVTNFYFSGGGTVATYVLIMGTERDSKPETFMALAL